MASCADHQQINLELGGQLYNIPDRMSGLHVRMQNDVAFFCHGFGPLDDLVKTSSRRAFLLPNFFDKFRHVIDLFDANHVKLGPVLPGDCHSQ